MRRPFLLYHWSPVARRKSILRHGLVPGKKPPHGSTDKAYRGRWVCFARFPSVAWALSAMHSSRRARWDLWCCWSDKAGPAIRRTFNCRDGCWWMDEYRVTERIPKRVLWHVGTREFAPRRARRRG